MKKIYILMGIAFTSLVANAQTNLIPNGSFEEWTNATPTGWTITTPANGGTAIETSDAHHLAKSAKITAPAGTGNIQLKLSDFEVTPGNTYTFSYWYKDESDNALIRHWGSWRNNTANQEVTITDPNPMKPDYMPNTTSWQQHTFTVIAPVGATHLRLDFRTYQELGNSGEIFLDDVQFFQGTLNTKENTISGLTLYPNPTSDIINIATPSIELKDVQIFDLSGKKILNTSTKNQVDVSHITSGIYIITITEGEHTTTQKIIIK